MQVVGVGTDLVDVDRFRRVLERTPSVTERLFTEGERSYAFEARDPAARLAVRFAAKEAAMKALGVGLGEVRFREIEVRRASSGEPSLRLSGSALERAEGRGVRRWELSLTHTDHLAQAVALALGQPTPAPPPSPGRAY